MSNDSVDRLVVAFNFPPFNDGSAVTVAKRIVESGTPVDVLSADLSSVRSRDESLWQLVAPFVSSYRMLKVPITFADQRSVRSFATQGSRVVSASRAAAYSSVWSRSMWPHSHFLAANLRSDGKANTWSAEFSDPILWHVDGTPRPSGRMEIDSWSASMLGSLSARGQRFLIENATVLGWAQFVPFLLADELIFTNEQQREVMLNDAPEWLRHRVELRSVILPHPTLARTHYLMASKSGPSPAVRALRIGYFGNFYANRGGAEFLEAISLLSEYDRARVRVDVYSDNSRDLEKVAMRLGLRGLLRARRPVPFLEFLAASESYDALLVNDIATSPFGVPSPFLPSKLSDYLGSRAAIRAVTIPGSPLDQRDVRWKAHNGDLDGITRMLEGAIADCAEGRYAR